MRVTITRELLIYLQNNGFTFLVAENQAKFDWYIFTPVDWNEDAFFAECLTTSFDDHMILSIVEALNSFRFEDYLNHEVILPISS